MEKGSPGVSNKIRPLAYDGRDPFNQNFRKFRSKTQWIGSGSNRKSFEKTGPPFEVVLQEVQGCPAKNCDFCNFCDSSKSCERLEKSQFLIKLIKSSGTGGRRVSSKNCDFSKNWEKIGEIAVFAKIN